MKPTFIASIVIIGALALAVDESFHLNTTLDDELVAYTKKLNYSFTARVDSVFVNKRGNGYLECIKTDGVMNKWVEDSLNHHLITYKRIRFLHFKRDEKFQIWLGDTDKLLHADSISVNSARDELLVFRDGTTLSKIKISDRLSHKVKFAFWIPD